MKKVFRRLSSLLLAAGLAFSLVPALMPGTLITADAEGETRSIQEKNVTLPVQIAVTYQQSEARRQLAMINAFRHSSEAWYWNESSTEKIQLPNLQDLTYDYNLEQIAMQRAAEIAMLFEHVRPNGEICFTATYEGTQSSGENILAGIATAEGSLESWKETNQNYAGQGHRRSILSPDFTAIGIGHVYFNGQHFWVQEFGYQPTNTAPTAAVDSALPVTINFTTDNIYAVSYTLTPKEITVKTGSTVNFPTGAYTFMSPYSWPWPASFTALNTNYGYQSNNTAIADASAQGITGISPGTVTFNLRAYFNNVYFDIPDKLTVHVVDSFNFTDVAGTSPYHDAIYWAAEKGITTGKTATTFLPDGGCTRAQFVTFLWRMNGQPEPQNPISSLSDISPSDYYYKAVLWAAEKGITTGYSNNTFRPDETCSRGAAVTFLYRAAGSPAVDTVTMPFSDMVAPSHAYYKGIVWAIANDVTSGYKDGTFKPFRTCSRGQNVTFLYRAKDLLS